jgi:DNA mismatch repair protein MSH3
METAALKQISEGKNKLFERGVTALYTATTFVDPLGSADEDVSDRHAGPALVCLVEHQEETGSSQRKEESVKIAWVAVSPSTGDVVWDEFEGTLLAVSTCHIANMAQTDPCAQNWRHGLGTPCLRSFCYLRLN